MKPSLLVVDPDPDSAAIWKQLQQAFEVALARSAEEGITAFMGLLPDLVVLSLELPDQSGLDVLSRLKQIEPNVGIVMLSAGSELESVVQAMKVGADNFVSKPVSADALSAVLNKLQQQAKLKRSFQRLRHKYEQEGIPEGEQLVLDRSTSNDVDIAAENPDTTVLLTGPTGAGKSAVAGLIHRKSSRGEMPFVDINCAGLSDTLLESELFGHERGAFTDAKTTKRGLFEVADGGTLFLDEIGEISPQIQAKFLMAIESKSFRRVGSTKSMRVDVRIIAATNVSLQESVKQGRFREDLFYRLNVLPIRLRPLRDRRGDIPQLVMLYLQNHAHKLNRTAHIISDEAMASLVEYSWPGNIRELRNVIDRAAIICGPSGITLRDLPREVQEIGAPMIGTSGEITSLRNVERQAIVRTLRHTKNNRSRAARILEIDVKTLRRKIKEYGIAR